MRKTEVKVENDVNIEVIQNGKDSVIVKVKGPKGEIEKKLKGKNIKIEVKDGVVDVKTDDKAMINTSLAHIKNMIKGVKEGYTRKMVIRYSHFPMNLEVKGNDLIIKNFIGEREPRKAKIVGNTSVNIKGQEITIEGVDKEAVSQTVANIRQVTKIREKDFRVFQDGIYPVE